MNWPRCSLSIFVAAHLRGSGYTNITDLAESVADIGSDASTRKIVSRMVESGMLQTRYSQPLAVRLTSAGRRALNSFDDRYRRALG